MITATGRTALASWRVANISLAALLPATIRAPTSCDPAADPELDESLALVRASSGLRAAFAENFVWSIPSPLDNHDSSLAATRPKGLRQGLSRQKTWS